MLPIGSSGGCRGAQDQGHMTPPLMFVFNTFIHLNVFFLYVYMLKDVFY